ncbi:CHCH domain protein (macronuclear) [Tetrahymena thermophila SB210]|uniref:CHCH domain protein n=1 Tax=Tetrahymena thermophila (strain SB210) TaxID=312017 RepID=I7ML69_TETTS|nr:CHCH domain protein [Tetrahymena thermophila SB210]EAS01282.2 CHCH domain protein [Tetrahymena thermophila SB210]|eukprot:XP_001021527.2 CHCH domain protein [Tetrahymena thermophila SB210]
MSRQSFKAPDKGSFPLDHFHECDEFAKAYNSCVLKHQLMPKRCRQHQIDYLGCRMKAGLMEKEEFEKLGFTEESSWENEEAEQRYLFNKIQKIKEKAQQNVNQRMKEKQQMGDQKVDYSKPEGLN